MLLGGYEILPQLVRKKLFEQKHSFSVINCYGFNMSITKVYEETISFCLAFLKTEKSP